MRIRWKKYIRDITAFAEFCTGAITKDTVIAYKQTLIDGGYAVRSINSMLASLNSLFSWSSPILCVNSNPA